MIVDGIRIFNHQVLTVEAPPLDWVLPLAPPQARAVTAMLAERRADGVAHGGTPGSICLPSFAAMNPQILSINTFSRWRTKFEACKQMLLSVTS